MRFKKYTYIHTYKCVCGGNASCYFIIKKVMFPFYIFKRITYISLKSENMHDTKCVTEMLLGPTDMCYKFDFFFKQK